VKRISIKRDNQTQEFQINKAITLLQALYEIKQTQDASLTFSSGCKSSICGACSVVVNGKEKLACAYKVQDGDTIEPLRYHKVLRDLKVDKSKPHTTLQKAQAYLHTTQDALSNHQDEKATEKQSDCILCDSCYSACPVLAVNPDFLGPFALTRAYRYVSDKREANSKETIDAIQQNGVWDCTLCGECSMVCPKGIDPKMDITMLRSKSAQYGYMDPNFSTPSFGTPNFGFDPNGGW